MSSETLLVDFGPGLAFRFEDLPAAIAPTIKDILGAFIVDRLTQPALVVAGMDRSSITRGPDAKLLTVHECVSAYQDGTITHFESPGIRAWCNTTEQFAGIELIDASPAIILYFVRLTLFSIVFELALTKNWYGMHAAAVAIDGKAILLPGDSGVGKTTIFRNSVAAGFNALSADLVWLRETPDGIEIRPLPRGSLDADAPAPDIEKAILKVIVCPSIVAAADNRLEPISNADLLQTIIRQSGFLSPTQTAERFSMLARIADSAPCHSLAAGRDQQAVPQLLRSLLV